MKAISTSKPGTLHEKKYDITYGKRRENLAAVTDNQGHVSSHSLDCSKMANNEDLEHHVRIQRLLCAVRMASCSFTMLKHISDIWGPESAKNYRLTQIARNTTLSLH